MIHLINMCNKFVALNKFISKLSDPYAKIDPDDLDCLDFGEFSSNIPEDEGLFWALRNLADQAEDLMVKPPGSVWEMFDNMRKIRKDLRDIERRNKMAETDVMAPWKI